MILADDQGWGDLSASGNGNLSTPHVDSLARDGTSLERFYVCAICSPTRAEMLTGRYHTRMGVTSTSSGGERLASDESTIGDTFKAAGYATGAFGKWHNGMQWPYHPNARGFDEYYGFCSGHWGHYFSPQLEHNGKLVQGKGFITDDLTDHAIDFIEKNKNKPFFCYLPYNTPHAPMQVPEHVWKKFDGVDLKMRHREPNKENLQQTRAALAMCENIDWNVGRIIKKLDELDLADDTILIYFSDNGPNSYRWNGDMKGRKGTIDEGGVRVPFLIRWPGHIPAGTKVPQIASAIDLLPTLTDLAGIKMISEKPLDGTSIKPLLLGKARNWQDRMVLSIKSGKKSKGMQVSVRTQQYRLDYSGNLFDIDADPGQRTDVSSTFPELTNKLKDIASKHGKVMKPFIQVSKARPFNVGYGPSTTLPARDGIEHGKIKRSNRAPNNSYFKNWTSKDDTITWNIDVAKTGKYQAIVYYTCAKENLGSTIKLSMANAGTASAKITKAFNPPLVGAAFDRADRGSESFVKDFKPLKLGKIELKEGSGVLTLQATDIPGKEVADIHSLVLKLKR